MIILVNKGVFLFATFLVVLLAVILGALVWSLWRVRFFQPTSFKERALGELSPGVQIALRPVLQDLGAFGFEARFALQAPASFECTDDEWHVICLESRGKMIAAVTAKIVSGKQTVHVALLTVLESGELIYTGNAPEFDIAGPPTDFLVELSAFVSANEQIKAHLGRVAVATSAARVLSAEEALSEYLQSHARELDFLEEKGVISKALGSEKECYRLRLLRIPFLAVKTLVLSVTSYNKFSTSWSNPVNRVEGSWDETKTHVANDVRWDLDEQMLMDLTEYKSQKKEKKKASVWSKMLLLVGSLILMVFGLRFMGFSSKSDLMVVIVILFVHELGHFAMMKIFGYKGLSIFFIPFFGAAATGRKRLASAREEFWVLMMGPLPGFVAGIALLGAGYFHPSIPSWLLSASFLSVIINGFNLLPLSFLDGGRILDLLLFRRVPRLRLVLMIGMAVLSIGIAIISGFTVLIVLAVLGLLGLISDRHLPKLIPYIRANVTEDMTESETAVQTMRLMREARCADAMSKPNWAQKVDELVDWSLAKRMGFCETAAACGLHGVLLIFPFAALVGVGVWLSSLSGGGGLDNFMKANEWREKMTVEGEPSSEALAGFNQILENPELAQRSNEVWMVRAAEQEEVGFNRPSSQVLLAQLRAAKWEQCDDWARKGHWQDFVLVNGAGLLLESAQDWRTQGNPHECVLDLSTLIRMYASCSVEESAEGWESWIETQQGTYQLFEEVTGEFSLGQSHRAWFHAKLAKKIPVQPESIVAMALIQEGVEYWDDFSQGLATWDEEEVSDDTMVQELVPMLYEKIREVTKAGEGQPELSLTSRHPAEKDFVQLRSLAENGWRADGDLAFECAHVTQLVQSVIESNTARERLSTGLQASLGESGKVRVNDYSQNPPLTVQSQE